MAVSVDWHSFIEKPVVDDPNPFPTGTVVFTGPQGSGKTAGMIREAVETRLRFPGCYIASNVVAGKALLDDVFTSPQQLVQLLRTVRNPVGRFFIIDEAHLYFRVRNGIPLEVLSSISQQRKMKTRIVFSTQVWENLDIQARKQVKWIVSCHSYPLHVMRQDWQDGETLEYQQGTGYVAETRRVIWYRLSAQLASYYDTTQIVSQGLAVKNADLLQSLELHSAE